ncbi:MAG: response regulator transcription factor [Clostridia bacterium]|nr:response regulator transcription factor [Clostridia bacterium]
MSGEGIKVLVVEDESSIRKFITINLKRDGFQVLEAESGEEALEMMKTCKARIIVLDVMLPGIDGFEVCQKIRETEPDAIIVMLTARNQDMDKIMGLELGADDYMVKPFNPLELVARIRTILRRSEKNKVELGETITLKSYCVDLKSQKFFKNGLEVELTPREFSIITTFMKNPGRALSRDELLNIVWGKNYFGDIKTVDVHIRRLREKIEDNSSEPQFIKTVWGYGYICQ